VLLAVGAGLPAGAYAAAVQVCSYAFAPRLSASARLRRSSTVRMRPGPPCFGRCCCHRRVGNWAVVGAGGGERLGHSVFAAFLYLDHGLLAGWAELREVYGPLFDGWLNYMQKAKSSRKEGGPIAQNRF